MARKCFLSFHYERDNWRVQTVKQMGAVEEQPLVSANQWEEIERGGDASIKRWIDNQMSGKSCLIVLIGSQTAGRKWVNYEIKSAFDAGKGVLGVHIHNLLDRNSMQSVKGANPFADFSVGSDPLTKWAKVYDPPYSQSKDVYKYISDNLPTWVEAAILARR